MVRTTRSKDKRRAVVAVGETCGMRPAVHAVHAPAPGAPVLPVVGAPVGDGSGARVGDVLGDDMRVGPVQWTLKQYVDNYLQAVLTDTDAILTNFTAECATLMQWTGAVLPLSEAEAKPLYQLNTVTPPGEPPQPTDAARLTLHIPKRVVEFVIPRTQLQGFQPSLAPLQEATAAQVVTDPARFADYKSNVNDLGKLFGGSGGTAVRTEVTSVAVTAGAGADSMYDV